MKLFSFVTFADGGLLPLRLCFSVCVWVWISNKLGIDSWQLACAEEMYGVRFSRKARLRDPLHAATCGSGKDNGSSLLSEGDFRLAAFYLNCLISECFQLFFVRPSFPGRAVCFLLEQVER